MHLVSGGQQFHQWGKREGDKDEVEAAAMGRLAECGEDCGFVLKAMASLRGVEMGELHDSVYDSKSSLWVPC